LEKNFGSLGTKKGQDIRRDVRRCDESAANRTRIDPFPKNLHCPITPTKSEDYHMARSVGFWKKGSIMQRLSGRY
jgi:hypothetical protein